MIDNINLNLKELSNEKLIELIETLIFDFSQLKELKEENKKLKAQLGLNSSNNSQPPSTDGLKIIIIILSEKKLTKIPKVNRIKNGIPWIKLILPILRLISRMIFVLAILLIFKKYPLLMLLQVKCLIYHFLKFKL